MGFGPKAPDAAAARQAVRDLIALLYPERATPAALDALERLTAALLEAKVPLSFARIQQFLADPNWRQWVLERAPAARPAWEPYAGRTIAAEELDPDFAWLLADRLAAGEPPPTAEGGELP